MCVGGRGRQAGRLSEREASEEEAQWVTKEIANPGISIAKLKHVETWSSQALDAFNIEIIFPWWVVTGSIQELDVLNIERILLLVVIPLVDSHKESSSA